MAIYHFSAKIISRSNGKSAVASAAYRSGSKLIDFEDGTTKNYKRKTEVAYSAIMLPENAPTEFSNRETLWNEVQKVEKNSNAQLAREIEIALPMELSIEENIALVRQYCQNQFVNKGMIADVNVHNKAGNPHAHIMLTMRALSEQGKWLAKERKTYALDEQGNKIPVLDKNGNQKIEAKTGRKVWERISVPTTDWNNQDKAEVWREAWAQAVNEKLQCLAVDHRSYERQGIEKVPTMHLGVATAAMEKRGIATEKGKHNRKVALANAQILQMKAELAAITKEITELKQSNQLVRVPVKAIINKLPSTDIISIKMYRLIVNDKNATLNIPADIVDSLQKKQKLSGNQYRMLLHIVDDGRKQQQRGERSRH